MSPAALVTFAIVLAIVALLGVYLVSIAKILDTVSTDLDAAIDIIALLPEKTMPVEPVLSSINNDLGESLQALGISPMQVTGGTHWGGR